MKSEPLAGRSSHWTTALASQWYVIGLILLTLFHFWLSAWFPPSEDELYYWTWAQTLQGSYYDHPPMVAWLISLSTSIFGDNFFGLRFFSSIAALAILLLLFTLTESTQLLTLLMFTPVFLLGAVLITPDTPLMFFWTLYLIWMVRVSRVLSDWSGDPVSRVYRQSPVPITHWISGGVILGLGLLSKYTMLLAIPSALLVFFSRYQRRAWIGGVVVHLFVALLVAFPVVRYNALNGFSSFLFQWTHGMGGSGLSFNKFLEFFASQWLLIGGLPFLLLPFVLIMRGEFIEDPRLHTCFHFFIFPLLVFFFQSLRNKLEGNWALVTYLAFWPIAQRLLDRSSFKAAGRVLLGVSFSIPMIFSALLLAHAVSPLKFVPPSKDRVSRMRAQYELSQAIANDFRPKTEALFTPTYQWTAYLRYQKLPAEQIYPYGRASHFTVNPKVACDAKTIYFLTEATEPEAGKAALECFTHREVVKEYPLIVRGEEVGRVTLVKYSR